MLLTIGSFEGSNLSEAVSFGQKQGIVFHQDNARPYTSILTHQKLQKLVWKILMHPHYSPDLAPSDYFCSCLWPIILLVKSRTVLLLGSLLYHEHKFLSSSHRKMLLTIISKKLKKQWLKIIVLASKTYQRISIFLMDQFNTFWLMFWV